ncbi:MAG: pantoate--beta-alanine ligase [Cyanobacteriota bacterium]
MGTTTLITKKTEARDFVNNLKLQNKTIGFVPTMGCFHDGHLSLIKKSIEHCDETIVSIFVNPKQFGPNEDFNKYPRTLEEDLKHCNELGVIGVFTPDNNEMYGNSENIVFNVQPPEQYVNKLCGEFRPGHFEGVATVVTKLFNIIPADKVFMGCKDAQQLFIIKKLVEALDIPIEIVECSTIREADGLACSSRNINLDIHSRKIAPNLYQSLSFIKTAYIAGEKDFVKLSNEVKSKFINQFKEIRLEYLLALDYNDLKFINVLKPYSLIAIAAKIGNVRLIDNIILN